MLSINSMKVYSYLKSYFINNKKPLTIFDIDINNMSLAEVEKAFDELETKNLIKLNKQYIYPSVEKIINL